MPTRRIAIAVPVRPGVSSGNSVTGARWTRQLRELGHTVHAVAVSEGADTGPVVVPPEVEVVIVLHARRCARAVRQSKDEAPERPVIVALAGTDLYADLPADPTAQSSLDKADAVVVLQEHGLQHLADMNQEWRDKAHVVHQSVVMDQSPWQPQRTPFVISVVAHLRDVKDPLLAAVAARYVPQDSAINVVHAGSPHSNEWQERAETEAQLNRRYVWLGEQSAVEVVALMRRSQALACTSKLEGGANVVSEAIAIGLPVIGTDIGGNRGLLGDDHPGLVPVGDAEALAATMVRLETDSDFSDHLARRSVDRQWMTKPAHERQQWRDVLEAVAAPS